MTAADYLARVEASIAEATGPLCDTDGQAMNWPGKSAGCFSCDARVSDELMANGKVSEAFSRPFIVCRTCGNKRCPRAAWHGNECSGSNESGQAAHDPADYFDGPVRSDAAAMAAALRAVLDLHAVDTYGDCRTCVGGTGWSITHPCQTVEIIEKFLGDHDVQG